MPLNRILKRRWWLPALLVVALLAVGFALAHDTRIEAPLDLPGFGHEKGAPGAPVVIIEFADFGCTACAAFARTTLPLIEQHWIATGKARLRIIPFDALRSGRMAARAAHCAASQDRFWPMHNLLYTRQHEWLGKRGQRDLFDGWALQLGMDSTQFRACWNDNAFNALLQRNNALAQRSGVPGTPAFVVNGRALVGALRYPDFATQLDSAFTRATARAQ